MTRKAAKKQSPSLKTPTQKANTSDTFGGHVRELRKRLFWVLAFFLIGSTLAYTYRHALLDVILKPLHGERLVYLTPGGGFSFIFQVSIYTGLIIALPILVYQVYGFIKPALPQRAHRSIVSVTLLATGLIISGVAYGYFVAIPAALQFLMTFAEDAVTPNLTADSYLSFFLAYIAGLALASLLPIFVLFWHWISPIKPSGLMKSEQWVVILAFIAAAIITPTPDALNQTMIAAPIIGIYQIGVIIVLISIHRQRRASPETAKATAEQTPIPLVSPSLSIAPRPTPASIESPRMFSDIVRPTPRRDMSMVGVAARPAPRRSSVRPGSLPTTVRARPLPRRSIDGVFWQDLNSA